MKNKKYLLDYLLDKRSVILLYLGTILIFCIVLALYQMDIMPRLLYAVLLSGFFWSCYLVTDAVRYIKIRRKLSLAAESPEAAAEIMDNGTFWEDKALTSVRADKLGNAYEIIVDNLCEDRSRVFTEMEIKRNEMADYYLMWAHQIKTPISALKLLIDDREDSFPLSEELFKVELYVDMALHYLRLESIAADMILKEYDLHYMVRQSVKRFSVLFINKRLRMNLEEFDVKVITDEKWLSIVLEQLISNCVKYTREGGISIYMDGQQEKTLVLEDTGIGICSEDLPRIFDRGFTGYNGRLHKKSTGIGLYLVKQVLEQLSHGIRVESMEGEGTRIYLDLSRESVPIENQARLREAINNYEAGKSKPIEKTMAELEEMANE